MFIQSEIIVVASAFSRSSSVFVKRQSMSYSIAASKLLIRAAQQGDIQQSQALIVDGNADVNYQTEVGDTPLHICCELEGRLSLVELLLGFGADPNISRRPTCGGETPLHIAVRKANYVLAQKLLSNKANANIPTGGGNGSKSDLNHTSLLNGARGAAEVQAHNTFQQLRFPGSMVTPSPFQDIIDQRKWVSSRTAGGRLPIHIAAELGDLEMCKLLVLVGSANIETADALGRFPKDLALYHGHTEVAAYLTPAANDSERPPEDVSLYKTQLTWHASIKKP